ncbi:uncharacterized protein FOMMEDRAFT_123671 [Fomitiporia mediterranea MF3/22]|uniref:uncharacterized protein n=1 Tax=Fomitiporia mediterranea (strain MF3/22) TaxID=694068 RepID=UPI0004409973|nr:uncharacterized protein FOMMEDRAFT_123671 [Fomitiporia mediterranea MF3/22]EJD03376.1 hypothetical protein FOMMEDRAFT_123671 [Fomitiporia mediterranea MF3/22]
MAVFGLVISLSVAIIFSLSLPSPTAAGPLQKEAVAYYDPAAGGGSMINNAGYGFGEPLNVIISGRSSSPVFTDDGFLNYARPLGFSKECFGLHLGDPQSANLGDGNGPVNQTVELRAGFGNFLFGTCLESLKGGNHLRMFRQNGPNANSGALFLAVSTEENVSKKHTISPDGYNAGRDALVSSATSRKTSFGDVTYSTTSESLSSLLTPGSSGVNHGIAQDGIVKLLTVTIY